MGTPKRMLKQFEQRLLEQDWEQVAPGVDIKLCTAPDGTGESRVLSEAKATAALQLMLDSGSRLPKADCDRCIKGWQE